MERNLVFQKVDERVLAGMGFYFFICLLLKELSILILACLDYGKFHFTFLRRFFVVADIRLFYFSLIEN